MKVSEVLTSLQEVYNTSRQDLIWKTNGHVQSTTFDVDSEMFSLTLDRFDLSEIVNDKKYSETFEVTFSKMSENGLSLFQSDGSASTRKALSVFSIVINAIKDKIPQAQLIFFSAKKGDDVFESRKALYQRLTHSLSKQLSYQSLVKDYSHFELYILSKETISEEIVDHLVRLVSV
jgi:hypothetical protein